MNRTTYIEQYLEGSLSDVEKANFEAKLKTEPELATDYELHLAAYELVTSNGALQIKEILKRHETGKYNYSNARLVKIILSVAAVVLMLTALFFLIPSKNSTAEDSLFATYFTPYRDPVVARGEGGPSGIRELATTAYRSRDFASALSFYRQLADPTPVDRFYCGLSALQTTDTEIAISMFKEVTRLESDYTQQASWYLALSYLKAKKRDEAEKGPPRHCK